MAVTVKISCINRSTKFNTYVRMFLCFLDIDECTEGTDRCAQNCHNNVGSYTCTCNTGYRLNANGYGCDGTIEKSVYPSDFFVCILNNHYVLVLLQTLMNVQKIQMGAPKTATTLWVATLAHAMLGTDSMLMVAHVMVS